ncbi:MAG: hypothetical protein ACRCX7_10020 [Cetobacterium sp.]
MTVKELKAMLEDMPDDAYLGLRMVDWYGDELSKPLQNVEKFNDKLIVLK